MALYSLNRIKHILYINNMRIIYHSLIYLYVKYGILLWDSNHTTHLPRLDILQIKAIRTLSKIGHTGQTEPLFKNLQIVKLKDIFSFQLSKLIYSHLMVEALMDILKVNITIHSHETRHLYQPHVHYRRT